MREGSDERAAAGVNLRHGLIDAFPERPAEKLRQDGFFAAAVDRAQRHIYGVVPEDIPAAACVDEEAPAAYMAAYLPLDAHEKG